MLRTEMIEAAAEATEALMDKYLEEAKNFLNKRLKKDCVQRTLNNEIVLVTCGSAFQEQRRTGSAWTL